MIRDISNEIVVGLKDRLRDVRHMIRASRSDTIRTTAPEGPEVLLGHAARVVDKALTVAEKISISLVSQDPKAHSATIEARSLNAYFPGDSAKGEALFRRDVYYLAKRIFTILGCENPLVHEATFAAVHAAMIRRHAGRIKAATGTNGLAEISSACAILAFELQSGHQAQPLPPHMAGENTPDKASQFLCFSAIALAIGLASYSANEEPGDEKLVESALLALKARQTSLIEATEGKNRTDALSGLFAFLIPVLP
ncbi:hypothetical protein [Phyllobacterium myrsinacearum]|uniref:Uncharacterized protein n=1 Tax=Phyllobacterium myrsinacearum TaxID=28101 RepID=A0A2S9JWZ1_9HYPH|nr:hypothetical protein [Phyllobacterium myrsinacearum]PRD57870.1 hypothetical protein C5750_01580 [Phyllobacterium myrsinacearum]PWV96037.1 hypothetical protein DEV92_10111 [Phyllobacterium myrsinacearum]RZV09972.1 hypothetical protein EV654_1075 [Phyllobacterium myrsinacearum]